MIYDKQTLRDRYKNESEFQKLTDYFVKNFLSGKFNKNDVEMATQAAVVKIDDRVSGIDETAPRNPDLLTERQ